MRLNTCRFCDGPMAEGLVKYGTRHYAHPRCYLKAGKRLSDLSFTELGNFPFFLAKEMGVAEELKQAYEDKKRKFMR